MLKATLLQPGLQPLPSCAGSSEISPCSYGFERPKADPAEGYGCLVLQQEKDEEGNQKCRPTGAVCPFNPKEQEEKNELSAGKWREHFQREGRNTNGDIAVPKCSSYRLASIGGYPATSEVLRSAPEMLHSGASTRADPSQEWKLVKVKRVLISPAGQPRKTNLSRSASLSEKELKEAKARSQKIAAQLTNPPSSDSKGVLLFNRRKQRVDEFTLESTRKSGEEAATGRSPRTLQHSIPKHGSLLHLKQALEGSKELKELLCMEDSGLQILKGNMEEYEENTGREKTQSPPTNEVKSEEILPQTNSVPSLTESPSGDIQQVSLMVNLKENIKVASTNGMHEPNANELERAPVVDSEESAPVLIKEQTAPAIDKVPTAPVIEKEKNVPVIDKETAVPVATKETAVPVATKETAVPVATKETAVPVATKEWNGMPSKQYYEVHLTLAKPMPVKNRTARPFGTQSSATSQPTEKSPGVELPPPPTYAETLFSPPPVTRVRSPPAYSALYPSAEQNPPVLLGRPSGESRSAAQHKTGILEESVARRASKKSMFTFVEKPKVAPNPDLLDLVQNADIRRKRKEQGESVPEEEPFALGAEASNFLHQNALASADNAPEWSSCLKSPSIQPKPQMKPSQILTEAKGKGAELFARRQSRMEKYVIESPAHPDSARSPSPTMSLPPSWKYAANAHVTPVVFKQPAKSPGRSSKTPPASLYNSNVMESEISQKALEIAKQQPRRLQSSLFIPSPAKESGRSLPTGAPPPQPIYPNSRPYTKHTSCPTSPLPPSPVLHSPALSSSSRPTSGPLSSSAGTVLIAQDTRTSAGALASPSRVLSPRAKGVFQAPRPSYSTRNAGIEPQERRVSLPASLSGTPRLGPHPSPLDGWARPEPEEGPLEAASARTPPPPMSPSWSERSLSPLRPEADPKASRQMQARLARNIINAARRKSSSPKAWGSEGVRPFTPPAGAGVPPASTSPLDNRSSSPLSPRATRAGGYRPPSAGTPQFNTSPGVSPRTPGSPSPTYVSPLPSPRAARADGHRYFTLPANPGAPALNAAAGSSPGVTGCRSPTYRSPGPAPKSTWLESHRILPPPTSAGVLPANASSCASPRSLGTYSPTFVRPVQSPTGEARSPVKRYTSRSPTDSDVSIDSEDSGLKSPGICSFNICPRGWSGGARLRQGSLPSEAPCTS
ncbi:synaptopodin [Emydura macquarii macquarii]|uniref:synaptopodin n=1 Tax=Emydura macquarii macquarii TaxID=1129001 RepID=UPI00352A12DA